MARRRRLMVAMFVAGGVLLAATATVVDRLNPTLANLPPVMHRPRVPAAAGPPPSAAPTTTPAVPSPSRSPSPGRSRRPPTVPAPPPTTARTVDAPVVLLSFEAEDAHNDLDGSADRVRFDGASGGRVVGYLGRVFGAPGTLRFPEVGVPAPGTYPMTVHYTASEDRVAVITVNGVALPGVTFRRSSGITTMIVPIRLGAGTNTIEFGNPTARCPAIDRIVLGV